MKNYKLITMIISLLYLSLSSSAANRSATITVHIEDQELLTQKMRLLLQDEYIYNGLCSVTMVTHADSNGDFLFEIKDIKKYKKIQLEFDELPFLFGYVEPGDKIKIRYSGSTHKITKVKDFEFSGPGSAKLALATKFEYGTGIRYKNISRTSVYDQLKLDSLVKFADEQYAFKLDIVDSYRSQISTTMKSLYQAEAFGISYTHALSHFDLKKDLNMSRENVDYLIHEIEKRDTNTQNPVSSESPGYVNFLWRKSQFKVAQDTNIARGKFYSSVFKDLMSRYTGQVREKAILYYICADTHVKFSEDASWVYQNSLAQMSTAQHRKFLQSVIDSRRLGVKAFDFKLTNLKGDTVYLHDFKGKVVVLDAWYSGCGGCAGLAKVIKASVLPKFGNNKDVVFLAVNIERTKKQWLDGLKSGLYTNEQSVNLSTYGLGLHHPLFQYYKFFSLPQLLLIGKDGNLISMDLVRNGDKINERIKKALD